MRVETPDFTFIGMVAERETVKPISTDPPKPRKGADIAREAATLAWRIRHESPDPKSWRARIESADPELRECLREYLLQAYRELQQRARREMEGGKRSAKGDEAMAALKQRYGGSNAQT